MRAHGWSSCDRRSETANPPCDSARATSGWCPGASAGRSPSRTRAHGRSASRATSRSGTRTRTCRSTATPLAASGSTCPPATRRDGRRARRTRSRSSRSEARVMPDRISRAQHALRHGPTADDRVRLGDTDLWIRIEEDLTEPGDQALWGYAKNWRSRMTQHDAATTASELDTVIGSVLVVDPLLGVVKCDLVIKDGRIAGIGRAGNPDVTDGVDLTIGPDTWPIPCPGLIATPAVLDSHVHRWSPRLVSVA